MRVKEGFSTGGLIGIEGVFGSRTRDITQRPNRFSKLILDLDPIPIHLDTCNVCKGWHRPAFHIRLSHSPEPKNQEILSNNA